MKKIIAFSFLINLTMIATHAQVQVSSGVYNEKLHAPLAYVNIGIKGKNIGTVSDVNGRFSLTIDQENLNDFLTFSFVGFESKTLSIHDLIHSKKDSIFIVEKIQDLAEFIISGNGRWSQKKYGISKSIPGLYGLAQSNSSTDIIECGQKIDLGDEFSRLASFHIYLRSVNTDSATFRINFYQFDENGPGERLIEKELMIHRKISKGWLEVDLLEYNLWEKGEMLVSIEFLPIQNNQESVSLYYGGILGSKGISYKRNSSLGDWKKTERGTYSIYLTTQKYLTEE